MRILHIDPDDIENPLSGGGPRRTYEIYRRLAARHEIVVLTPTFSGSTKEKVRDGVRYLRLGRRIGDALWPEHKSRAELEKIRDQDPINFQALYQQHPVGAGARMFKREWLEATNMNCRYDPIKQPPAHRSMNKLMLVDSANAKKKRWPGFPCAPRSWPGSSSMVSERKMWPS